jgi:hypothetical protein
MLLLIEREDAARRTAASFQSGQCGGVTSSRRSGQRGKCAQAFPERRLRWRRLKLASDSRVSRGSPWNGQREARAVTGLAVGIDADTAALGDMLHELCQNWLLDGADFRGRSRVC